MDNVQGVCVCTHQVSKKTEQWVCTVGEPYICPFLSELTITHPHTHTHTRQASYHAAFYANMQPPCCLGPAEQKDTRDEI